MESNRNQNNTEFDNNKSIKINQELKFISTESLEEDPLSIKYRNIVLFEKELLDLLKNPQLPTLITNIQYLELLLQKIDKQINENNFYHIEMKWTGDGITDGESNDDIFDLDTSMFTEEELKEYMLCLHSFYEIKLKKLKSQYLDIFYGDKYKQLITE